jgi:hypothetical protein
MLLCSFFLVVFALFTVCAKYELYQIFLKPPPLTQRSASMCVYISAQSGREEENEREINLNLANKLSPSEKGEKKKNKEKNDLEEKRRRKKGK